MRMMHNLVIVASSRHFFFRRTVAVRCAKGTYASYSFHLLHQELSEL